jgi:hypothetical protein
MTIRDSVPTSRLSEWLVNLFSPPDEAESILGDLQEEFLQIRSCAGIEIARRWYSRQIRKTIVHLFFSGLRTSPLTWAAVVGGLLLLRLTHTAPDWLLSELTDKYLTYWSNHFAAYLWLLRAMWIEYLTTSLFTGCVIALFAKGREIVAVSTVGLILCALAVIGSVSMAAVTGHFLSFWSVITALSDPAAIILGGVIVRRHRSAAVARLRAIENSGCDRHRESTP